MTMRSGFIVAAALLASGAVGANASVYDNVYRVTASEGSSAGGFDTATGNPFVCGMTGVACASFVYTGPIAFSNLAAQNAGGKGDHNRDFGFSGSTISMYSGGGTVSYAGMQVADFNTRATFLSSSGSAADYHYGTYFTFDLGIVTAGTVLTISHDDGISLFQGTTQIGQTTSGPTGQVTETVRINTTGDTILRYARENGTPSVLIQSVPEPASMGLLGLGLTAIGLIRRRNTAKAV